MTAVAALLLSAGSVGLGFICGLVIFWQIHQKLLTALAALVDLQVKLEASEESLALLQQTLAPVPVLLQTIAPVLPAILQTIAPVPVLLHALNSKLEAPPATPAAVLAPSSP